MPRLDLARFAATSTALMAAHDTAIAAGGPR